MATAGHAQVAKQLPVDLRGKVLCSRSGKGHAAHAGKRLCRRAAQLSLDRTFGKRFSRWGH
eukprot:11173407-Lingulodinium_polyedra.AAC.1